MASFIERAINVGDFNEDGGPLDREMIRYGLELYSAGAVDAAWLKTLHACTTAQGDDLDEILATMPTTILTVVNALARAQWPSTVSAILLAGGNHIEPFDTEQGCRDALGLS